MTDSTRGLCPFQTDDDVLGVFDSEAGVHRFSCTRVNGHPHASHYAWTKPAAQVQPATGASADKATPNDVCLADELNLHEVLPAIVAAFTGTRVEFGVVEHAYATAHPKDFAYLVDRYGHTAIRATRYSASAYLGVTLSRLSRQGLLRCQSGPATGRWSFDREVTWSAGLEPAVDTELSWVEMGLDMSYVPGNTE